MLRLFAPQGRRVSLVFPKSGPALGQPMAKDADGVWSLTTGPLALYRVKLEGSAFTESPALVTKVIDGAAVWVPGPKP